jgi:hypothetical protein
MLEEEAGRLKGNKLRHSTYSGIEPPFVTRNTLYERASTVLSNPYERYRADTGSSIGSDSSSSSSDKTSQSTTVADDSRRSIETRPRAITPSGRLAVPMSSIKTMLAESLTARAAGKHSSTTTPSSQSRADTNSLPQNVSQESQEVDTIPLPEPKRLDRRWMTALEGLFNKDGPQRLKAAEDYTEAIFNPLASGHSL